MKEVTKWDNNPREMWVWDRDDHLRKMLVVYIVSKDEARDCTYPVIAFDLDTYDTEAFMHCAEIEPSRRRMTNKELSRWLREKPNREWKDVSFVHADLIYRECEEDTEVSNDIYVREGDSPWFVPFAEEE